MFDRKYFFNRLLKELTHDVREPRYAIYFDSNPPELDEFWYLTDKQDGKGYTVQEAHEFIPVSLYEQEIGPLEQRFGPATSKGTTYEFAPFFLGTKRNGFYRNEEKQALKEIFADRENYKVVLFNHQVELLQDPLHEDDLGLRSAYSNPHTRPEALEDLFGIVDGFVDEMNDEDYAERIQRIGTMEDDLLVPITRDEAVKRAWEGYWQSGEKEEEIVIEQGFKEDKNQRIAFRNLSLAHIKFD